MDSSDSTTSELLVLPAPQVVYCRWCGQAIDVWEPLDFRLGADSDAGKHSLTPPNLELAACRRCCLQVLPEEHREGYLTLQKALVAMRNRIDAPELGTLYFFGMTEDSAPKRQAEFHVDIFAFRFSQWDTRFVQPRARFTPDDQSQPDFLLVFFGADVVRNATPATWLQFWWSYANPLRPGRLEVMGWDDPEMSRYDFVKLVPGIEIFREVVEPYLPGRPKGSAFRDANEYLELYRDLRAELGKQPTQDIFLERYNLNRNTVRRNLKDAGLWPWAEFVKQATRARTIRRN